MWAQAVLPLSGNEQEGSCFNSVFAALLGQGEAFYLFFLNQIDLFITYKYLYAHYRCYNHCIFIVDSEIFIFMYLYVNYTYIIHS